MAAKNEIVVKKSVAFSLVAFFVVAIIATGVLVHYYSPDTPDTGVVDPEPPSTTAPPPPEEVDLRLPTSLKPLHYVVQIQPFLNALHFSTNGFVAITFQVMEPTSTVTFHMVDIITINSTIKLVPTDNPNGGVNFTNHAYDNVKQFYIGSLVSELEVGKQYTISFHYKGYLNEILMGFYRSSYFREDKEIFLATTHFEATAARRAFPCFDEPALKATYDISIARTGERGVISNMPSIGNTPVDNEPGWFWEHFDTTLPMSSYLVAFIESDFVSLNSTENDHVLFRVWARKEAISQGEYAIDKGPKVLTFYEDYFSIPFPLPKQDMAALPDFDAGAMENWGLITYRETALLYDPLRSGASNRKRVATVIAHELAHQWFGDLVSPAWWNDIWLNEGFASYMEYLATDDVEPTFQMLEQFITDTLQVALNSDSIESSHPISADVNNPDEIWELFDDISYSKGASVIRMMNYYLTEPTFRQGLTNYLTALSYASAEQDDLWYYLTEQAHKDGTLEDDLTVKQIMDTWTLQMGYPVVTVTRNEDRTATVTQERFLLSPNPNSTDTHDYVWWIPLTYTSGEDPSFNNTDVMFWMGPTNKAMIVTDLPSNDTWIIFNVMETGYYRVNYDVDNWNQLIDQLMQDFTVIDSMNRAQIIDDSLDLARAGLLDYDIALSLNSYVGQETELVPWYSALDNLAYLEEMFTRTSGYGSMKNYLLSLSIPLYNSVGFDDSLDDPYVEQFKRVAALNWMCNLQYGPCLDNAVELFNEWMMASPEKNESIISPNLIYTVYCYGIAEGNEAEWDFAWSMYLNSNLGTEKDDLLSAMGCSKIPWILERYMEFAFTDGSGIKKQDSYKVFNAVARNDYGRDLAWSYLRSEWDNIAEYYSSATTCSEFTYVVSSEFNTETELQELEQLKADHYADLGTATQEFDKAIERVKTNIKWMEINYDIIDEWLNDNGYGYDIPAPKGAAIY